ncbi:MAG TPA: NADAR family protein [Candidatus Paceibacterota bacterium]|jgi:GTP cyclohydrolase II|nr:NADAR family protein [Candidatus Paceibacterota bacterium]
MNPKKDNAIHFIGGGWKCFSNFSSYMVEVDNILFPTSEHAYQYQKFESNVIKKEILNARSAYEAKIISQKYKDDIKPDWDSHKLKVMEDILRKKLLQNPHIKKKLLETGDRELVENSKDDNFWGRGPDFKGYNHCGKIWMKLRSEIVDKN